MFALYRFRLDLYNNNINFYPSNILRKNISSNSNAQKWRDVDDVLVQITLGFIAAVCSKCTKNASWRVPLLVVVVSTPIEDPPTCGDQFMVGPHPESQPI